MTWRRAAPVQTPAADIGPQDDIAVDNGSYRPGRGKQRLLAFRPRVARYSLRGTLLVMRVLFCIAASLETVLYSSHWPLQQPRHFL